MNRATATIEREMFQHEERDEAVLISPNGNPRDARWLPKRHARCLTDGAFCRPHGQAVLRADFRIARWKADELGWLPRVGEGQGSLAL